MAHTMLSLLGPPRPPAPPPPVPPPPPPPPAGGGSVVLFQQGGNGTLRLELADFSPNKGLPGSPLGWDYSDYYIIRVFFVILS